MQVRRVAVAASPSPHYENQLINMTNPRLGYLLWWPPVSQHRGTSHMTNTRVGKISWPSKELGHAHPTRSTPMKSHSSSMDQLAAGHFYLWKDGLSHYSQAGVGKFLLHTATRWSLLHWDRHPYHQYSHHHLSYYYYYSEHLTFNISFNIYIFNISIFCMAEQFI